jgi:hypothetical protein
MSAVVGIMTIKLTMETGDEVRAGAFRCEAHAQWGTKYTKYTKSVPDGRHGNASVSEK